MPLNLSQRSTGSLSISQLPQHQPKDAPRIDSKDLYIGELIGTGGFCVVHAASMRTGYYRYLAIKCTRFDIESPLAAKADLDREANILSSIGRHPNIIRLHGITTIGTSMCLVVDRLDTTLSRAMRSWKADSKQNRLLWSRNDEGWKTRLERVALGVASGLRYLHECCGVVHRDVKPDNIGFDDNGNAVLYDFGLARQVPKPKTRPANLHSSLQSLDLEDYYLVDDDSEGSSVSSQTNCADAIACEATKRSTLPCSTRAGTVKYMAPEIARCEEYGVSADIYSFGILLWELVSLRTAYSHLKTRDAVLKASTAGQRPSIRALPTNRKLRKLVNACWHQDPSKRPSAAKIQATLGDILQETPPTPMRPRTYAGHKRTPALLGRTHRLPVTAAR